MSEAQLTSISPERAAQFFSIADVPWGWRERASTIEADKRPGRLDLGAGMLRLADGSLPVFKSVRLAEAALSRNETSHAYLPPAGLLEFRDAAQRLLLGREAEAAGRSAVTFQTIGGAGALRLAAEYLARSKSGCEIYVSAESWADHRRIFEKAGLTVRSYPYFSESLGKVDTGRLLETINRAAQGSIVMLQASCHNPTGCDLDRDTWRKIFEAAGERRLLPLFDVAYPGLGRGLEDDLWPVRECTRLGLDMMTALSCCKSFSLYDERVGALTVAASSQEMAQRLESQIKTDIQASYSSPPRHGAQIIAGILKNDSLRALWMEELEDQRRELLLRRAALVNELSLKGAPQRLLQIGNQSGLFAWTGLGRHACERLAAQFAIYVPSNGRVCIAAIPARQAGEVASALIAVSGSPLQTVNLQQNRSEKITSIIRDCTGSMTPSPLAWVENMDYASYAVRQATSCLYLKVLFPGIIEAAPETARPRLSELFSELNCCHLRQYDDLAGVVQVPPVEDRSSYYFDQMYRACEVTPPGKGIKLDDGALIRLLAVHAVSYRRGYDRYLLLKECANPANRALLPVWSKFSADAPRNAWLTTGCMLDMFGEARTRAALEQASLAEKEVMDAIWSKAGIKTGSQ